MPVAMKDLTHYFASPPKSQEDDVAAAPTNREDTTDGAVTGEEVAIDDKSDVGVGGGTPPKTRSRVKIRISVNGSRTRRCDIIENADDVIEKTPSPFASASGSRGAGRLSVSDTECAIVREIRVDRDGGSPREEHANAFEVMMTRGRPPRCKTLPTSLPRGEMRADTNKSEEYGRNMLEERKRRLVALADRKGYSKRKHADLEEAQLIENRLKKRVKLFGLRDDGNENGGEDGGSESDGREMLLERVRKTKAKWTMKVKLQSHSNDDDDDDDDDVDAADGNPSDDDYIFTPKSKVKFCKSGIRKSSKDGGTEPVERRSERKDEDDVVLVRSASKRSRVASGATEFKDSSHEKDETKEVGPGIDGRAKRNPVAKSVSNAEGTNDGTTPDERLDDVTIDETYGPSVASASKKLAPLFVKKSKSLSATAEARRSFLQSGIPAKVKRVAYERKSCSIGVGYPSMPFPVVSHVGQLRSEGDLERSSGESRRTTYKLKSGSAPVAVSPDSRRFASMSGSAKVEKAPYQTDSEKFVRVEKTRLEDALREIESRCSNARVMWTSVSLASNRVPKKSPKKRSKKLKLQRESDASETEDDPDGPNPTWTCKYKPTSSAAVVGNDAAVARLKDWLSGWRSPPPNDDRSSGDEFDSSDGSNSGCCENNQVAVLLGPHGSGKTASVYAIAEELQYRVLEVNASSRRTGKKILTDFQEATKSHRVKRGQKTLSAVKRKPTEEKNVPQNSLILIEDVDIIFDEDEGFVSATCQLAANTRRPIVMTCRELCPHLNKMAPRQQLIRFQAATGSEVSALLELISLAESGYRLPKSCSDILARNGDLRQSLLQLQYVLLTGPPSTSQLSSNGPENLWQETRCRLYRPAVKRGKKKREKGSADEENAEAVDELSQTLDCVLLISSLTEVENPTPPPWRRKLKPSLSLVQDFRPYSGSEDLSRDIADWLRRATLKHDRSTGPKNFDAESHLRTRRNVKLGIDLALSQAVASTLERRSKSTDYLPVIRTICRAEQERSETNTKRRKRFHNYLHGLNMASTPSNVLAAASSVFQDKLP